MLHLGVDTPQEVFYIGRLSSCLSYVSSLPFCLTVLQASTRGTDTPASLPPSLLHTVAVSKPTIYAHLQKQKDSLTKGIEAEKGVKIQKQSFIKKTKEESDSIVKATQVEIQGIDQRVLGKEQEVERTDSLLRFMEGNLYR